VQPDCLNKLDKRLTTEFISSKINMVTTYVPFLTTIKQQKKKPRFPRTQANIGK
jgi:hypothetical protein